MLKATEKRRYREKYDETRETYRRVSEYVIDACLRYKGRSPNTVRVVFSREPQVKTFDSLIKKIEDKREENPGYSYDDLTDIIALTVLCPYRTDELEFIGWLKKTFKMHTKDKEALKHYPSGHGGYHYIISIHDNELPNYPDFRGVKCEVQIKTILEEAFDAKTHDLTYKPGRLEVREGLQKQFSLLARSLHTIDEQSELLKASLLEGERELTLRREASVIFYLEHRDTKRIAKTLKVDLRTIHPGRAERILKALRAAAQKGVSVPLCKLAALCALKLDNECLRGEALEYADRLVKGSDRDAKKYYIRGTFKWALGQLEGAIEDAGAAVTLASDDELRRRAENDFVYFVADCAVLGKKLSRKWRSLASRYLKDLQPSAATDPVLADTVGYYLIALGDTSEDIDSGRQLIRTSLSLRKGKERDTYMSFFRLHEYVGLKRLFKLAQGEPDSRFPL